MTTERAVPDLSPTQASEPAPTAVPKPNRGGAPRGNQNARKHGFYSTALTPEEQEALGRALELKDLTPEIALMRVKLMELVSYPETSPELVIKAARTLTRMVGVQHEVTFH